MESRKGVEEEGLRRGLGGSGTTWPCTGMPENGSQFIWLFR